MKLLNSTRYDTQALRRIVTRVHNHVARYEGRLGNWRWLQVEVITRRGWGWGVRGRAALGRGGGGGTWMQIALPMPGPRAVERRFMRRELLSKEQVQQKIDERWPRTHQVADLIEHEFYHLFGYDHRQMRGSESGPDFWKGVLGDTPIPLRPERPRKVRDMMAERYARAQEAVARWQTRAKRASTMLAKARRRVRYYEKAMAARQGGAPYGTMKPDTRGREEDPVDGS